MAARIEAQPNKVYARRTRSVWTVLAISMALFCAIGASSAASLYNFLSSLTQPAHARVQLIRGTQLTVIRQGRLDPEAVQNETSLSEGDMVQTGPDTEANVDFFDGSTALLSFNTHIRLADLHTNRFFGSNKEITLDATSGTLLFSTADKGEYPSVSYNVTTPQAEVNVEPNSTVRVNITGSEGSQATEVAVTAGSAKVMSGGKSVELNFGYKTISTLDNAPTAPQPDEEELVRNGDFTQPPTSRAEQPETGLDTAAWMPFIEEPGGEALDAGTVTVTTEYVSDQSVRAARIDRQGRGDRYGKVGLRQDINKSVSYFHLIELTATVKVVAQTEPVGGPQEDVFPVTVKVLYTTPNNQQREWVQSFYYCPTEPGTCEHDNATVVPLGQYETPPTFVLKRPGSTVTEENTTVVLPDIGQDISVIKSIEIYGLGSKLQSWITDVSLTAR